MNELNEISFSSEAKFEIELKKGHFSLVANLKLIENSN